MSDHTALTELANFVGRSSLLSEDVAVRNRALAGIAGRMLPRKRGVGDLLSVVLTVSTRTRRMVRDPVSVDIDVFAPGGTRAVRLNLGER
ncbi:MAG: hypothetical protein MO852_15800 [Candidatus Devosia euplotis]|nr:hypothetical protein [Candidatus Devosia euplotis]